ncbi:hypothetical protein [Acinetobacter baumannii]|uniref:hypothetical protein n=1 Tax=Acinetobacter baumannii TaxID=470 RepID=UPI002DB84CEF|nr:hypothetical protein [Acinetobacter baumannii]MEB6556520.1 hypothetical protein [Acinetobacter baumannii]
MTLQLGSFIRTESEKIQAEANQYRDDVVGKSSASTSGQSSAQKKKRATTVKSKAQSQKL